MTTPQIFGLQSTMNLIVYALVAHWYIAPRLAAVPLAAALMVLLFPHARTRVSRAAIRHVGRPARVASDLLTLTAGHSGRWSAVYGPVRYLKISSSLLNWHQRGTGVAAILN